MPLYRAFPIRAKALTVKENQNYVNTYKKNNKLQLQTAKKRSVFKAFLKLITDGDCLSGRSFQYFEADTVNVLSPANMRVTE